jgi:hypothetical protein
VIFKTNRQNIPNRKLFGFALIPYTTIETGKPDSIGISASICVAARAKTTDFTPEDIYG